MSPLDVLLVIRARAELFPPTVNQANLLASGGLKVGMVHLASQAPQPAALDARVRQWHAHTAWDSSSEPRQNFTRRWTNWLRFARTCRAVIRSQRPKVVLGYDPVACTHLQPAPARRRTVYHFHELPESYPDMGMGPRRALSRVGGLARKADLVVFSDQARAERYQNEVGLSTCPQVVMNCPLLVSTVPASPLRQLLANRGLRETRVVGYVGCVGWHQGLREAALSMRNWPADSVFVLVGPHSEEVREGILAGARAAGTDSRVLFLGPRPHAEALALAAGADLGLTLIQPHNQNRLYSAGACNKRFEYMALGVPQLTNNGPGVADIVERSQCGVCVDPNSPEEIGAAVNRLLHDPGQLRQMGSRGRAAHREHYNYQAQFRPVLEWIMQRRRP